MSRIYNFSAGPATLPLEVLEEAKSEFVDYKGCGMSLMEVSHRGVEYAAIHEEVKANIAKLAGLNDDYSILFLGGGASTQFALVPMNLCAPDQTADYTFTGVWAKKAIAEAKLLRNVNIVADTSAERPLAMPNAADVKATEGAAYLHITTNETIAGTQWKSFPEVDVPLVGDMSSEMFSRPFDVTKFGCIYAGAQKNLGPSGVTLVIVRKDLAERVPNTVPNIMRYTSHMAADSLLNTPPTFPVYVLMLVTRWILKNGGLEGMAKMNEAKAAILYDAIDATDFYIGSAAKDSRSLMNVTFRLPSEELEAKFIKEAAARDLKGLKGHRSVGGIRPSIYNAFPREGVEALVDFMKDFEKENG